MDNALGIAGCSRGVNDIGRIPGDEFQAKIGAVALEQLMEIRRRKSLVKVGRRNL